jgi:RimJ/RimL family protein N-acetyltransferase
LIDPDAGNTAAIRCYEKAGFHQLETVRLDGEDRSMYLMTLQELDQPAAGPIS